MPVLSTATGFLTLLNLPMPTLGDARRGRQSSRRFDQRHAPYRPFAVGSSRLKPIFSKIIRRSHNGSSVSMGSNCR